MDDDSNIIKLPTSAAVNAVPITTDEIVQELLANGTPIGLPAGSNIDMAPEGLGFSDMEAAFNMRDWLQRACEAHGGRMVGGGFGCGQADIDIDLDGCRFNISIRPLSRS